MQENIKTAQFVTTSAGANFQLDQEGSQAKNLPRLRLQSNPYISETSNRNNSRTKKDFLIL